MHSRGDSNRVGGPEVDGNMKSDVTPARHGTHAVMLDSAREVVIAAFENTAFAAITAANVLHG